MAEFCHKEDLVNHKHFYDPSLRSEFEQGFLRINQINSLRDWSEWACTWRGEVNMCFSTNPEKSIKSVFNLGRDDGKTKCKKMQSVKYT